MPLVVICGLPSSGKSTRAREIAELLGKEDSETPVHVITDDFSSKTKNELYCSSKEEKISRGDLKSKVKLTVHVQ